MINHPYKTAKGLKRYVRDILQQVQQEETLKKIIDISSKIESYPWNQTDSEDKKSKILVLPNRNPLSQEIYQLFHYSKFLKV